MALVNHAKKEINAKIVYYGLAGSGKSTSLTYIYSRIKPALRGDLKSIPAGADNLQFFDFSPFETPLSNGYRVRLHVYTLTGIVTNPATWKMTLKGADGIIIMVNPAAELAAQSKESVSQLRDYLSAYGVGLHETPAVLQLNSFSHVYQPDEQSRIVAGLDLAPLTTCSSNTATGEGVLEALTTLSRQILDRVMAVHESSEGNIPLSPPSPEAETEDRLPPDLPVPSGKPQAADFPHVVLLSREVVSEGATIRIPLEITLGNTPRRLVVTVNVDLEQQTENK